MNDPLALLENDRINGTFMTPETNLVRLTVWCPNDTHRLMMNVGPRVADTE